MAVGAGVILPGVAPVGAGADDRDRGMRHARIFAGSINKGLSEISGSKLAQTEFGGTEMVDAGGKARRVLDAWDSSAGKIRADDIEFDFVEGAGTGGSAKESFSLRMLLAADDSGGEEQELRQRFEIGDGLSLRWSTGRRNCGKCGAAGVMEIAGQARHFERGINLEKKGLVVPIERVGMRMHALI